MATFNPEWLVIARGAGALPQSAVAKAMGWSQGKASKVENGLIEPTSEEVTKLAALTGYPKELFMQPELPAGFGSCCTFHRKRLTTPIKALGQLHDQINIKRLQVSKLLISSPKIEPRIPHLDVDEYESPAAIARLVRATWQLPRGKVTNLVDVIESVGGIVIQCDFPTPKIDAVSQRAHQLPPMFFLNRNKPVDRWRLSLAHELGHIVMHSAAPSPNAEQEADEFAAEFLMPEAEIKKELTDLSISRAASLKLKWRTSMQAIIVRAYELGAITKQRYTSLFVRMSQSGYRKHEPNELERESPKRLADLLLFHLRDLGYSVSELARVMLCSDEQFRDDYLSHITAEDGKRKFGVVS